MKKTVVKVMFLLSLVVLTSIIYAGARNDLKHLGYSNSLISEFDKDFITDTSEEAIPQAPKDEADSLQQQLVELAATRDISAEQKSRSGIIRSKIENYWSMVKPSIHNTPVPMSIKQQIAYRIRNDLTNAGYTIVYLKILDLPENNPEYKVKAIIRAFKPMVTKNKYKEIQKNLAEINSICKNASTIQNHMFLSEMTTFIAENPENKYYYAKTILNKN